MKCGYATRGSCGYAEKKKKGLSDVSSNIRKINFKETFMGQPIATCNAEDFFTSAISMPSRYNPPKMKTILTPVNGTNYAISNIRFKQNGVYKTVQFICVDGNNLSQYEFENPDTVINFVNSDRLPVVNAHGDNIGPLTMTNLDGYSGSIWYCLFYHEVFNRVGVVDEDRVVFLSVVNVRMSNAFWNSHYMTYGDGSETPGRYGAFTSLDIVGHEASHGVVEASGGLTYFGESGALNESIADIFGTCLEKYYDVRTNSNLFDWEMGEDIGQNLRSMANPKSCRQPDTYKGINWVSTILPTDNGGVHTNSGVSNFMFYLLCSGGTGTNDKGTQYNIDTKIQIFKAGALLYKTLTGNDSYNKIYESCTYKEYAKALEQNLEKFATEYKLNQKQMQTLPKALIAIGIRGSSTLPEPPTDPTEPEPPTDPTEPEPPTDPHDSDDDSTEWPQPDENPPPEPWPTPGPEPWPTPVPEPWPIPCPHWPFPNFPLPHFPFPHFPFPQWPFAHEVKHSNYWFESVQPVQPVQPVQHVQPLQIPLWPEPLPSFEQKLSQLQPITKTWNPKLYLSEIHKKSSLCNPTPRASIGDVVNLSDLSSNIVKTKGHVHKSFGNLVCNNGSEVSTFFFTRKNESFNGLELELELDNPNSNVTMEVQYYGSTKTLDKFTRFISKSQTKGLKNVVIPLPRTQNTHYLEVTLKVDGDPTYFKNLKLGYY